MQQIDDEYKESKKSTETKNQVIVPTENNDLQKVLKMEDLGNVLQNWAKE